MALSFPIVDVPLNPNIHPLLSGLTAALQNKQQAIENKYLPDELQQKVLAQQLANQQAQATLPYAAPMEEMKLQTMPLQAMGSYYGGLGRMGMSNYYNNPATQISRVINSPAMESLISTNPDVARNIAQSLAGASQKAAGMSGYGTQGQAPSLTEDDYRQMQGNISDTLNRKTTTAQILNQRQYAGILDNLFDQGSQLMPSVSQYAGLAGKGQKGIDALKSSFGETSPTYQEYLYFSRTLMPSISNEMRRVLGGQATDYEGKLMKNLADPTYIDSNPEQAMKQYQYLVNTYKGSVNPALSSRPTEVLANLKSGSVRQPISPPSTSQKIYRGSNGKQYTKEELLKISGGQ